METMVDYTYNKIYKNQTVLVTGHTGFKGSWLCSWLIKLGAKVIGYSLKPNTTPNHFDLLDLDMVSVIGDILDKNLLEETFLKYKPNIVFHLAAQPLVRYSYLNPVETFETNIMGTINVFESCRKCDSVKAIVNITSDKCYENKEQDYTYNEDDKLGGYDPYSASKGCAELVTSSYRNSFFKTGNVLLASCRAGNVIGGGDWADDRLIPDIVKSIITQQQVTIRNPKAVRPWQHVLEPLSGYLLVGKYLLEGKSEYAAAWNFGPNEEKSITVEQVLHYIQKHWDKLDFVINQDNSLHEATLLNLNCSKAYTQLNWKAKYNVEQTFDKTIKWYKEFYENDNIITIKQLEDYTRVRNG